MYAKFFFISALIVFFIGSNVYSIEYFNDDFNTPHDYLVSGVVGTGWDGFVGLGTDQTADKIEADMNHPGQLYLESTGARWEIPWIPLGPFLYKEVLGDFTATVLITDFAGCPTPAVYHNDSSIMARVPYLEDGGPEEDIIAMHYFATWTGHMGRSVDDGIETEFGFTGTGCAAEPYIQLERIGNTFYYKYSADGVYWTELVGSPKERPDLEALPMQVGLTHATYSDATGYVAFDNFSLIYTPFIEPYATHPIPRNNATNVYIDVDLKWTSGDLIQDVNGHEVYFGTNLNDVNNATKASHPNVDMYIVSDPCYNVGTLSLGQKYYWRVDEVNEPNVWKGIVWNFTTSTGQASDPIPTDKAVGVQLGLNKLYWTPSFSAISQDVYFGTSFEDVNSSTTPYITGLSSDVSDCNIPGEYIPFGYNETYYWRVDTNSSLGIIKGNIWTFTTASETVFNDITFFVGSDLHYGLSDTIRDVLRTDIVKMNALPGTEYPASIGGGYVNPPRGVAVTGDLTERGGESEWLQFPEDFGLTGDKLLAYPVYEGYGNHDGGVGRPVREGIKARNQIRPNINLSSNGLHYSWDWDQLHLIQLNIYPGVDATTYSPEHSLEFLMDDLSYNLRSPDQPIVIFQHFGCDAFGLEWWAQFEQEAFYNTIKNYNILGIFHGHTHGPLMYQWNGFDFYNVGSMHEDPNPRNFGVAHITSDKMLVAYRNMLTDTWGIVDQKTISFPPLNNAAYGPTPRNDPNGENPIGRIWSSLSWRPGVDSNSYTYDVYFGKNKTEVENADNTWPIGSPSDDNVYKGNQIFEDINYGPLPLELNTTYYWRIDEINESGLVEWPGYVWSFTVGNYVVVDNFESYMNIGELGNIWSLSGVNGALVDLELFRINNGLKSMEYVYNNTESPYFSQIAASTTGPDSLEVGNDWKSVKALTLSFYGDGDNSTDVTDMFVMLKDGNGNFGIIDYNEGINESKDDIAKEFWQEWNIDLRHFSDVGVDLNDVDKIYIGFDSSSAANGLIYFDDIRLYTARCVSSKVTGDLSGDCIVDCNDLSRLLDEWLKTDEIVFEGTPPIIDLDASGLDFGLLETWNNDGTLGGFFVNVDKYGNIHDPTVETVGNRKAVTFDGGNSSDTDIMQSSFNAPASITGNSPFSVAVWMYNPAVSVAEHAISWTDRQNASTSSRYMALGFGTNTSEGDAVYRYGTDLAYNMAPSAGQWHHVAWTYDGGTSNGADGYLKVYIDGSLNNFVIQATLDTMAGQPIHLGAMYWTGHYSPDHAYNGFSGSFARVQFYDYELSEEQIIILSGAQQEARPTDLYQDSEIDFKDIAILANMWYAGKGPEGPLLFPFK